MKKMKNIRNRRYERGVALMFSLGILGLMAVLVMTFASVSMTNQETTENSVSEYSARSIADIALARSLYAVNSVLYGDIIQRIVLAPMIRADELVSGGDAANITASRQNPNRQDFDYLWKLVPDTLSDSAKTNLRTGLDTGYHTDFINSMRFRIVEGFGQRPENSKSFNAGITTNTFNASTTPFWQYVREPVNNAVVGRYAYLAYRSHGLLDMYAFSSSSSSLRRLGLSTAEMNTNDLLTPAVNGQNVYGRWSDLANLNSSLKIKTASDALRKLINGKEKLPVADDTANEPDKAGTKQLYPKQETALNNLFGKWFRTAEKLTPDVFWYKENSEGDVTPYLRFNLNRSLDDWNRLTVEQLTTPSGHIQKITNFNNFPTPSNSTPANAIQANATTCIPWFRKEDNVTGVDRIKRCQTAANFLAWFQSTPATAAEVTTRGLWGRVNDDTTGTFETDTNSILNNPSWTANMRTPYIREVAVEMEVAFTLEVNNTGKYTPPGGTETDYISEATLQMSVTPHVYVSLIDFFNTGMTDLKIRLPETQAPQVQILLPDSEEWNLTGQGGKTFPISLSAGECARTKTTDSTPCYILDDCTLKTGEGSSGETSQTPYDKGTVNLDESRTAEFHITRCGITAGANSALSLPVAHRSFSSSDAQNLQNLTFTLTQQQISELKCRLQEMCVALYSSTGVPYDYSKVQSQPVDLVPAQGSLTLTVTASAGSTDTKSCYFMTGFHCRDVRSNLNAQETRDGTVEDNWRNWGSEIVSSSSTGSSAVFNVSGSDNNPVNCLERMRLASEVKHNSAEYSSFVCGKSSDDSTLDHTLPTYSTRMRPELPPYSTVNDENRHLYPTPHPWEIGMINRGEAFRTINLTRFNGSTDNSNSACNGIETEAPYRQYGRNGFGSYADGDANILDQIMVTGNVKNGTATLDPQDSVGKIDVNSISFMGEPAPADLTAVTNASVHQARFAYPNRGNLYAARLLFGNSLRLIATPLNTFFYQDGADGKIPSATTDYLDGKTSGSAVPESSIQNILEGIAEYNRLVGELNYIFASATDKPRAVRRYKFHSRAEILRENVNTSSIAGMPAVNTTLKTDKNEPLETAMNTQLNNIRNAFIQSSATLPDTTREELFCKTVMLMHADDAAASQPDDELVVFGIAQAIKDTAGTVSALDLAGNGTFVNTLSASSASPGSAYRTYAGTAVPVTGLMLYKAFSSYPEISITGTAISANNSVLSGVTDGTGVYRVGFDKVLSTQRVIGWLKKDSATGRWRLVRVQYAD